MLNDHCLIGGKFVSLLLREINSICVWSDFEDFERAYQRLVCLSCRRVRKRRRVQEGKQKDPDEKEGFYTTTERTKQLSD